MPFIHALKDVAFWHVTGKMEHLCEHTDPSHLFAMMNIFLNSGGVQCESRIRECATKIQALVEYYKRQITDPVCLWGNNQKDLMTCFINEWEIVKNILAHFDRIKTYEQNDGSFFKKLTDYFYRES